jgi:two-component system, NtrC family, sensor kinase
VAVWLQRQPLLYNLHPAEPANVGSADLETHPSYTTALPDRDRQDGSSGLSYPFGRGVRQKLVLVSLLILIVVSFGFLVLHRVISSAWIDEDLRDRAVIFGQEISAAIEDQEEFGNSPLLEGNIRRRMAVRSNVLQVDILKLTPADAVVVASSNATMRLPFNREDTERVRRGKVVSKLAAIKGIRAWDTLVPIIFEGAVVGAVATRFSLDHADRLHFRINLWALVFTGISVLLMGYLMALAVSYTVNRPITRLLSAIRQVYDGNTGARAHVESRDEFETLAGHFNDMVQRMNSFNEELDKRIRNATRELDEKYHELRRLNTALYMTQRSLGQAERLAVAGQVVAQVAHEVGTPLHSVAGHLELLRSELPPEIAAKTSRRLEIIESQVARVSGVIRQLLDLVRRDRPAFTPVEVSRLLRESADLVAPGMSAAGVTFDVDIEPRLPEINGNRDELMQVMLNLLSNALDATPAGGAIGVHAHRGPRGDEIRITVRDTGVGIAAERQKEIFEPFVSTKPPGKGTGLGLYIATQIMRDHGGRIEVQSTQGQGSTLTAILPIASEVHP